MSNILNDVVFYSNERVSLKELTIENYVTTDNLLQNKLGKVNAEKLPSQEGKVTKFSKGDILISNIRPYLKKIWLAKYDGGSSADVLTLKVRPEFDSTFIYYSLFRDDFFDYVMNGAKGTKMPRGDKNQILEFHIPNFEKSEQKRIAKVLSDLDAKIELNNKINTELEAMAKTLYDYWFVQFDFPDKNGKPYKSSGGKMVWNEELKREIPEGWNIKTIGDYCKSTGGFAFKSSWWTNVGMPVVKIKDIQEDYTINLSDLAFVDISNKKIDLKFMAKPGDVLIAMTGATVGKYAIVPHTDKPLFVNQRVGYFNLGDKPVKRLPFLINSLNQKYFRETVFTLASGAAQPNISNEQINNIHLLLPTNEIIEKYNNISAPYYSKILLNQHQNQELASLRDWLLPMLMNGQVTVVSTSSASKESYVIEDRILKMVAEPEIKILSLQEKKLRRKMLATFIVNQSLSDTRFGKTKFEKLLHLIEYHIVKDDFNQKYSVQTAGPYDGGFTKLYWDEVLKAKWFKIEELGNLKRIVAGENHSKSLVEYNYFSEELKESISQFISLFKSKNYEKAEIVSTLFAVWNNRIIKNEMVTDTLLKKDFLEWDKQKSKYAVHLDNALAWMRKENVIPDGWGKYINRAKGK